MKEIGEDSIGGFKSYYDEYLPIKAQYYEFSSNMNSLINKASAVIGKMLK